MKISVLTPTYNRAELLKRLYASIVRQNWKKDVQWLIMDDGSTDNTEQVVKVFIEEHNIEVKYYKQSNSGKMTAINNLVKNAEGDLIIECDSDDYFSDDAFEIIRQAYEENKDRNDIYAMCFLKYDLNGNNIGQDLKKQESKMFDLYFKDGENGEKALVYFAKIRKKYEYKLEKNEKFVTEARLHHEMDLKYNIKCYNEPIMICEYQKDGYTKNIQNIFIKNPYGYYEYFKEILQRDMKRVLIKKRLYVIKHYILFKTITKKKNSLKNIFNIENKILYCVLFIPGTILSKIRYNV